MPFASVAASIPAGLQAAPVAAVAEPAQTAAQSPFQLWLAEVEADARMDGVSAETLHCALATVVEPAQPMPPEPTPPKPIAAEQRTVRLNPSWNPSQHVRKYVQQLVPERVATGAAMYREHAALLRSIEADFGVPPEVTLAIWGVETSYGSYMGTHDTVQALVVNGFEERGTARGDWFRAELIAAMLMLDRGLVDLADFQGSYAGAVGQCQFMPSNYFTYAVDYDSDGKADIWRSVPDSLASIANFLKGHGYMAGQSFGVLAELPDETLPEVDAAAIVAARRGGSFPPLRDIPSHEMKFSRDVCMTASQWREAGAKLLCERSMPDDCLLQAVSLDEGEGRLALLAGPSSGAILRYNPSYQYVAAVVHLANSIHDAAASSG